METENLDAEIARLELEKKHNLLDEMQKSKLSEFKAIKEALSMPRVVFSCCPKCESTNGNIIVGTNKIQCADCFDIRAI